MAGKYQAYPEYKESEVDWLDQVPTEWEGSRLKYLCKIKTGEKDTVDRVDDGEYPFFVRSKKVERISSYSFDGEAILTVGDGDIGKIFHHYNGRFDYHQRVYKFSSFKKVYGRFFYHYLNVNLQKEVIKLSAKTTVDSLRLPMLENFVVVFPSLQDQMNIAEFLDFKISRIDTLIEKQQQLIKLLKEKRQAVISHAVTKGLNPNAPLRDSGVEWLGEVPEHWKITRLKYQVEMLPGYAFKSTGFVDSSKEVNLLRGINISPGKVRWDETVYWPNHNNNDLAEYVLQEKDLVLGMDRPWVGGGLRLAMISNEDLPAYVVQRVARIRGVQGVSQEYLFDLLSALGFSSYFDPITTGVSVPHISTDQIGEYYFALPPKSERREIVEFIGLNTSKFKKLMDGAERAISLMKERRTALISAAVTGKIDVRHFTPEDGQSPEQTDNQKEEVAV